MKKFDFKFENDFGLHARPAGVLVKKAGEFESNITVVKGDGNRASAKGLFALLGLKIEVGDTVSVEIEGPDEEAAMDSVKSLFESDFKNFDNNSPSGNFQKPKNDAENLESESIAAEK